ncbi:hypothetical protein BX616_005087 [Lobosporangium transversale]|nr:hypothetical protein BX616_005087 [Lobosporangium transversale]
MNDNNHREYWKEDVNDLRSHLETNDNIHLFDVPLHYNFVRAASEGPSFDMRTIFDGSLLIYLRFDGFPCLFYGDFYGIEAKSSEGSHTAIPGRKEMFSRMLLARKEFAYGDQNDYLDHPNCIGWVRHGDRYHPRGLAVVMSNSNAKGYKKMNVGSHRAGQVWVDMMGYWKDPVTIKEDGWAKFYCHSGSVSLWVQKEEDKSWITVEESSPEDQERHAREEDYAREHANDESDEEDEFEAPHPDLPKPLDTWDHLLEDDQPRR